jgi:putative N6-adenine-specific DNA methylase
MTRYFATCARGLEPVLAAEIAALGATAITPGRGGVRFEGPRDLVYKACLHLRTAVRVLLPVIEGSVRDPDRLYDLVRSIDWAEYLTPRHTLAVDANVRDSAITHSQYAARRVKDAICDQFRDATGERPSVDVERPMLGLNLHIHADDAVLSLDAAWDSLHKRGYRPVQTRAPINESLAAGLLLHMGYDGSQPLADLMCGSGTFLVEAAMIATKRPPGLTRKWFSFMGWPSFDVARWKAIRDEARPAIRKELPAPIFGCDIRADAVRFADENCRTAGLRNLIRLDCHDLHFARPQTDAKGLIIVNPPYGERLGELRELVPLYRELGHTVRCDWFGWRLGVFTLNDELAHAVDLKIVKQSPFYNGSLPCKLWQMECFA